MGFSLQGNSNTDNFPGAMCDQILGAVLAANQNDFSPSPGGNVSAQTANTFEVNCTAASNLTGIAFGKAGRQLRVVNIGAATITILAENAGSVAANRFNFAATIAPGEILMLQYSVSLARWCAQNTPGADNAPVGANPTAQVGLAAVNGVATTFLRSDGAPALSQAIAPTWSETHIFAKAGVGTGLTLASSAPILGFNDTDAGADARLWWLSANGDLSIQAVNDAISAAGVALQITRIGATVATITYGNPTNNPQHTFEGAVLFNQDATVAATKALNTPRVYAAGDLDLGTFAANQVTIKTSGTNRLTLSAAGALQLNAYGAGALTSDASGNITAVSDERLKDNIRPFARGLDDLLAIETILHGYTTESGLDQSKKDYVGFSAQNLEAILPEAVGRMREVESISLKPGTVRRFQDREVTVVHFETDLETVLGEDGEPVKDEQGENVTVERRREVQSVQVVRDPLPFTDADYLITYKQDPARTVSDRAIIALLVNAVRELAAQVRALQ